MPTTGVSEIGACSTSPSSLRTSSIGSSDPAGATARPEHPEIELALVELARETRETRYAQLALFFLGRRGQGSLIGPKMFSDGYYQDRVSVYDAEELEGHAVRQLYLTSGMTDMYLEDRGRGSLGSPGPALAGPGNPQTACDRRCRRTPLRRSVRRGL